MEIVNLQQGSAEWLQYRATKFNASDAPSMLNMSKHRTRNDLLRTMHLEFDKDPSWFQQKIFDKGHRFEAQARARAEQIIGEDLVPVVGCVGKLSASFDGITFLEDTIWEHKTLNDDIRLCNSVDELHVQYHIQMEQQLMVSGAEKCLFHATIWSNDNTLLDEKYFWYESMPAIRKNIVDGWAQFEKDLSTYTFVEVVEPPKAEAVKGLPAVTIQVKGELTLCNLADVIPAFDKFLTEAKTELLSDEDFAQAEEEAKVGRETAKKCKLTAKAVVDQMASVSDAVKTLELYAEKFDKLALAQEKAVKEQKEARKAKAKLEREKAFQEYIVELEKGIEPIRLSIGEKPDFVGVMKAQRTLSSLYNKLDSELARVKIIASNTANELRTRLDWFNTAADGFQFLFSDLQQLIYQDDIKFLVASRIDTYKAQEQAKAEAERQRIAAEEKAKLEAEKIVAERQRVAAAEETTKAEKAPAVTPEKLRASADRIEESARYADRTSDMQREMAEAQNLRRQANQLEAEQKAETEKANTSAAIVPSGIEQWQTQATTITIPTAEFEKMMERLEFLDCLEAAGVDCWDGYSTAVQMHKEHSAA